MNDLEYESDRPFERMFGHVREIMMMQWNRLVSVLTIGWIGILPALAEGPPGPFPIGYPLEISVHLNPAGDRLAAMVTNRSGDERLIDTKTVGPENLRIDAFDRNPPIGVEITGIAGDEMTVTSREIRRPNSPITLRQNEFVGRQYRLSTFSWLAEARQAALRKPPKPLGLTAAARLLLPGQDNRPVEGDVVLSTGATILDRELLTAIVPTKPGAIAQGKNAPVSTRFSGWMSLDVDKAELLIAVVCVNPREPQNWQPPSEDIDLQALDPARARWSVNGVDVTPATEHATSDADEESPQRRTVRLGLNEFVGHAVAFPDAPFFSTIEAFFDNNNNPRAACTLTVRIPNSLPGDDMPNEDLVLTATISRETFERILFTSGGKKR